jgi:hypothetical protein
MRPQDNVIDKGSNSPNNDNNNTNTNNSNNNNNNNGGGGYSLKPTDNNTVDNNTINNNTEQQNTHEPTTTDTNASINTNANTNTNNTKTNNQKLTIKMSLGKWIALITTLLIIAAIITFAVLLARGVLYIGAKTPEQRVIVQTQVCNSFFGEYKTTLTSNVDDPDLMRQSMSGIITKINNAPNNEDDPSCQYILYYANLYMQNYDAAVANAEKMKKLHEKGQFVDNNTPGTSNLDSMIQYVNMLSKGSES